MTNIQELETQLQQLTKEIEQLKRGEEKEEWPKVGDEYFFFYLNPMRGIFEDCKESVIRKNEGNMFRTKRELENARLCMQSIETCTWQPKARERYFYYDFGTSRTDIMNNTKDCIDLVNFMIGNCHQTKEENEEWYRVFGSAWGEKIK